MTTATIPESFQFNTVIQAKGKQRNNDGWTLTVDWKLPGSKFELVLYGQDWEQVKGYDVGHTAYFDIAKGGQKSGKSGKYASDFFWNPTRITAPVAEADLPASAATAGSNGGSQDEWRRSKEEMRYLECLKVAAMTVGAESSEQRWQDIEVPIYSRAADIYNHILDWEEARRKPAADAQDGATLPAEAPDAGEPSQMPAPALKGQEFDPRKVLRASFDHYNSDAEALGMEPLDMRVVAAKVSFKFGDIAKLSPENAATAAKAVADGSIVTWPTGEKS